MTVYRACVRARKQLSTSDLCLSVENWSSQSHDLPLRGSARGVRVPALLLTELGQQLLLSCQPGCGAVRSST